MLYTLKNKYEENYVEGKETEPPRKLWGAINEG